MAKKKTEKPHAAEPGHYRSSDSLHGWMVLIDYAQRLKLGGPVISRQNADGSMTPNASPWVIWHPASGHFTGFAERKDATTAFEGVVLGKDVNGLLAAIQDKQIVVIAAPAQARVRLDVADYPKEFMRALQEKFPPDVLMERLETAMTAETPWSNLGAVEYRPDWSARLKALELATAYMIGRPIERQQILQATAPMSWESIIGIAKASPVFRETLQGMLRELEQHP